MTALEPRVILRQSKLSNFNMLMDFLQSLNWIDIALVGVLIRAVFIGVKSGFVVEFFKSIALIASVFLTLHYFAAVAVFVSSQIRFLEMPTVTIFVFVLLWSVTMLLFKLIRDGILMAFSIQAQPIIDRWGGAFLSSLRGVVVCSMVFYLCLLSYNPMVIKQAKASLSRHAVSFLPTGIYAGLFNGFVVKFFPQEKLSEEALLVPGFLDSEKFK